MSGPFTDFYTASSVDGFIAAEGDDLTWLFGRHIDFEHGPHGYAEFIADVGALCMGASSYQFVLDNLGDEPWPYQQPTWVFTHRDFDPPPGDVRFTSAPIAEVHAEMTEVADGKNLWVVGGGELVCSFHDLGLLDRVWVQYAPVALGSGAPLLPRHVELSLDDVQRNGDFVCVRYDVLPERAPRNQDQKF